MFQGPKRQRNHLEIYGRQYLEGRRTTEKGSEQTEARGPNEHGPRGQVLWPRGTPPFGPWWPSGVSLLAVSSSGKITYLQIFLEFLETIF